MIVELAAGRLKGQSVDGVIAFKGIPYGEAVAGRRRWQRSSPVTPWEGVKEAVAFGPRAIQPESSDMRVTDSGLEALLQAGGPSDDAWRAQSEECLTLNVWAPDFSEAAPKRPVMFWCHGGKYFGEVPPVWWFDGENLARSGDVVVVTVRHRVGVLGFLHLADLAGGAGFEDAANVGLLDLVDALKWVRDNIGRFGGDAGNVTIFGESGGGLKVSMLLCMPEANGLFQKAIVQSGAQLEAPSRAKGTEDALALLAELGLGAGDVDQLFEVPPQRLVDAQIRLTANPFGPPTGGRSAAFEPIVDGKALPIDCFDPSVPSMSRDVSLMVGTCATETAFFLCSIPRVFEMASAQMRGIAGRMLGPDTEHILDLYEANRPDASATDVFFELTSDFIFRRKAIRLAEHKLRHGGAPVYMYVLAFETDVQGGRYRTPHVLDVPLVFAHPEHPILGSDPGRFAVSQQMSGAWAAFAHTGNPGTALLPAWPAYEIDSRHTMVFNTLPHLAGDPRSEERTIW